MAGRIGLHGIFKDVEVFKINSTNSNHKPAFGVGAFQIVALKSNVPTERENDFCIFLPTKRPYGTKTALIVP